MEIVIDGEPTVLGALADAVHEVVELPADMVEPPPRIGHDWRTRFVRGIGKRDDRFVLILDIDKVFSHRELLSIEPATEEGTEGEGERREAA